MKKSMKLEGVMESEKAMRVYKLASPDIYHSMDVLQTKQTRGRPNLIWVVEKPNSSNSLKARGGKKRERDSLPLRERNGTSPLSSSQKAKHISILNGEKRKREDDKELNGSKNSKKFGSINRYELAKKY